MLMFISGQGHFGLSLIVVALSRVKGSTGYKDWHAMSLHPDVLSARKTNLQINESALH